METIDPAAASIREMGEDIVKLHLSGDRIKALGKAEDLARAHQGSPMALILFADLLREAARQVDRKDLKDRLNKDAEEAYGKAAGMLPNCIDTKVCHGEILVELERFDMAEVLLTSALESENPIDPAEHILTYGVSRPLRSTPATRIRDVRKRAMKARERNRENLAHIVDSRVELVLAIQERNVALKRAAGLASIYPFSVRVHLLHAHMTMRFVHSLPDRLHKTSLNRVLTVLDKDQTCDFQKSVVVFLFRAKVLYLLREYAASEQLCSHALMIKGSDDPALQDIPPGSVWGCDREERISTCRAQLSWLLVKLVAESIAFSLTPSNQQERVFFFSLASLRQHYHGSNSVAVKVLFAAEKQFNLHNTCIAWMCPCCKRRNLATPEALLEHIITVHVAHLPQKAMLGTVVKAFEGNKAAVLVDWPSDELVYDADSKTFRFEDVFSVVKSVTESHLEIPFVDSLQKKRFQAAKIYEKIEQLLLSSPTECSAIESENFCSEVMRLWKSMREVCKLDLLLPLARTTLWRDILKQMSLEAKNSNWDITSADMETLFNYHNELPVIIAEVSAEVSDEGTYDDEKFTHGQIMKKSSDPAVKVEQSTVNYKGRCIKLSVLEKKLKCIKQYLRESSSEDHSILMILQFLFNMSTFRDEVLRGSLNSEQEVQLIETVQEVFSEWRKQDYARISDFVSSFKECLLHACNDSTTFPQARQAYASDAVAMVLKRLCVSVPSTFGIKLLLKSRCDCGRSCDTESIVLMLKFDTACMQNSQVKSFSELKVLYEEPQQCFDCGNTVVIDVSVMLMPPCFQIVLDWSTGGSPSTLYELMAKLNSSQEVSFFHQGLVSEMKYKLTSMICWSKGLYVFFGREKKRWLIFDKTTAKTHSWSQILEIYESGNLQPEILCFESVRYGSTWSGPKDIVHPGDDTITSQEILSTPQQHFRSSAVKSKMQIEEDDGDEELVHLRFKEIMSLGSAEEAPCLMCHLKGDKTKPMNAKNIHRHCKQFHSGAGIQCSKKGCHVRGKNKGDIGKHEMYCHR